MNEKTKSVLAVMASIATIVSGIVIVLKSLDWLKGITAWQFVFVLAVVYLAWYALDRYATRINQKLDTLGGEIRDLEKRLDEEIRDRCKGEKAAADTAGKNYNALLTKITEGGNAKM